MINRTPQETLQDTFNKVEGCHSVKAIDFVQNKLKALWGADIENLQDWQSETWDSILAFDEKDDQFCSDCIAYFQDFLKAIY